MTKTDRKAPSSDDIERAERIKEILEALYEVNKHYPIVVEGKRDAAALRKLGLSGEVITLHNGKGLYDFCEDLADRYSRIVILMDWDDKGEGLCRTLSANLKGHFEEYSVFRGILKVLCQKDIKDIEGIPKLLSRLSGDEFTR